MLDGWFAHKFLLLCWKSHRIWPLGEIFTRDLVKYWFIFNWFFHSRKEMLSRYGHFNFLYYIIDKGGGKMSSSNLAHLTRNVSENLRRQEIYFTFFNMWINQNSILKIKMDKYWSCCPTRYTLWCLNIYSCSDRR